jgi:hypothetical protein
MESNHLVFCIKLEEKHRLLLVASRELLKKNRYLFRPGVNTIDSRLDEEYRQAQLGLIVILHFLKKGCSYVNAKRLTEIIHHLSKAQQFCLSFSDPDRRAFFASISVAVDYVYDVLNDFFDIKEDMLP